MILNWNFKVLIEKLALILFMKFWDFCVRVKIFEVRFLDNFLGFMR